MATFRWAVSVIAAGLLVGCVDTKKADTNQPAAIPDGASVSVEDARNQFKTANPLASVGVVKSVRADEALLAASDLSPDAVPIGDAVSIVAANVNYSLVARGVVHSYNGGYAIINFTDAARTPVNGDLVIRVPANPHNVSPIPSTPPATAPSIDTSAPSPAPAPPATQPSTDAPAPATDTPAPAAPSTTETPKPA